MLSELTSGYWDKAANLKTGNIFLLIIDPQVDFHTGSLKVPGAVEDSVRIADLIAHNYGSIDSIYVTMDSHHRNDIAHAAFWYSESEVFDTSGNRCLSALKDDTGIRKLYEPKPFTVITTEDILRGLWQPMDQSLMSHCIRYTKELEEKQRFKLMIWPDHCLIGTKGHCVVPNIHRELMMWSRHTRQVVNYVLKGTNNLTEMYSAIQAEVPISSDPTTTRNSDLLDHLSGATKLIVCGQALSHCVQYTLRDVVEDWLQRNLPLQNIHLLVDGSSPVEGCEEIAQQFVIEMRNAGVTISSCYDVLLQKTNS